MGVKTVSTVTEIKVYSIKELAGLYSVCPRTFNKWLIPHSEKIGVRSGRFYNVAQIQIIFESIGLPKNIVETY
jgi:hypothetical protein